jgi:hypothetical protein
MGATGDYGVQYAFDTGPVRVIMISPGTTVDGTTYDYNALGPQRDWVLARLDEAERAGLWTIVGMHKVCITTGDKSCDVGQQTIEELIDHGADLILQGHEHNYQRSHQLGCIEEGTVPDACIVDTDSDFIAERGTVIAIAGWVGKAGYDVSASSPEAGYFAVIGGPNIADWGPGYLTVTATPAALTGRWTTVGVEPLSGLHHSADDLSLEFRIVDAQLGDGAFDQQSRLLLGGSLREEPGQVVDLEGKRFGLGAAGVAERFVLVAGFVHLLDVRRDRGAVELVVRLAGEPWCALGHRNFGFHLTDHVHRCLVAALHRRHSVGSQLILDRLSHHHRLHSGTTTGIPACLVTVGCIEYGVSRVQHPALYGGVM